jgi:hypothetical protein
MIALEMVDSEADVHSTDVAEDHEAVVHAAAERMLLTVKSLLPKLRPLTVTDDLPLNAAFSESFDATGASKVYVPTHVPATAPTVTPAWRIGCKPSGTDAPPKQLTDVEDDQEDVEQAWSSKIDVEVRDAAPKLRPVTVTEACPLGGAFR